MTTKHSIVQLETFVKLLSSKNLPKLPGGDGDVQVLSKNPDGSNKTVWGPPLFRPSGTVINTCHPDKPHRQKIEGPSLHRLLRRDTPNHKEWVTDDRWYNPVIRLEFQRLHRRGLPRLYKTFVFVICFDTFHDSAGVCHWIIDTIYLDLFGVEDIIMPGEDGGKWNLSHEEATLWLEAMVRCSKSKRVDTMQVGENLFTDSPIPLTWGPPLSRTSVKRFDEFLLDLGLATRRAKYAITMPDPSSSSCTRIALSIDKVRDFHSCYWGNGCIVYIFIDLHVQANVRKVIISEYSFRNVLPSSQ